MTSSRTLTMARAGREAVMWEMEQDPRVFMLGEDVYKFGGVFGTADGLGEMFGADRILDTPISETGFIGLATGAAIAGMRPIVELAFIDFIGVCYNAIVNLAAKHHYLSNGQVKVPMVLMLGSGGGYNNGGQHSQALHACLAHMPGMKVVAPSNAYDAKGFMHAAIRSDDFVVYIGHKKLSGVGFFGKPIPGTMSEIPSEPYTLPFGEAKVVREGIDATIVAISWTVHQALDAAEKLAHEGIDVEVIDPRTLVPLDRESILKSVAKTGHLIVADEDYQSYGFTAEVIASVAELDPTVLKSAPVRVANPDVTIPYSRPMEQHILPTSQRIQEAVRRVLSK
ncbi:alpha-ketoacid dehydrogenase subunit beta [Shewanella corallii]|uniref:Alpha-ketoacid dehydrogenase subunit beta n=1 Tax=Shewanella corallii TaxID=560080 RepID=A0ABT0NAK7_9GAMM|nr:transketolase C-terminal domain-containing protein [Shewanella corallii]MCL2915491.1 alpha-ketoacid dehydrogenase subunit beta [Shewanella corallii]